MKTTQEDLERIQKSVVAHCRSTQAHYSDHPLDPVHADLKDLKIYEAVQKINTKNDLIQWVSTFYYLDTEWGVITDIDFLDAIRSAFDYKTTAYFDLIPVKYGLRAKAYQLVYQNSRINPQYKLDL